MKEDTKPISLVMLFTPILWEIYTNQPPEKIDTILFQNLQTKHKY